MGVLAWDKGLRATIVCLIKGDLRYRDDGFRLTLGSIYLCGGVVNDSRFYHNTVKMFGFLGFL